LKAVGCVCKKAQFMTMLSLTDDAKMSATDDEPINRLNRGEIFESVIESNGKDKSAIIGIYYVIICCYQMLPCYNQ